MSTISEIGGYLVTQSVGALGSTLFLGPMPMGVSEAVSVIQLNQRQPIRTMGAVKSAPVADIPVIQVMVRNTSFSNGESKVKAVIDALDFYSGSLDSITYYVVNLDYGPMYLGLDENNRHRWTMTFSAVKKRS